MTYLDSAILVKLYVDESDSEHWRNAVGSRDDLVSSALALPEMKCALRRNIQAGLIKASIATQIWDQFRKAVDEGTIRTFPIGNDVIEDSIRILDQLPSSIALRTLDTIHLATARLLRCRELATNDRRMRAGATALQIPLI